MGRGLEVDELAPAEPSVLGTLGTLLLVASLPWVVLALTAWVGVLMGF